jgi:uncharacterized protein (DUF924 family)
MLASSFLHPRIVETLAKPDRVIDFWRAAGPEKWFAKDSAFDLRFRTSFADAFGFAIHDALAPWEDTPQGALALVLLLDQYPRNAFRGTDRMYATDPMARAVAGRAIEKGHDGRIEAGLRMFFYLPFAHSEALADQDRSVALFARLGEKQAERAEHHRSIVARFGRFPHRNAILGRTSTAGERSWLAAGGYAG